MEKYVNAFTDAFIGTVNWTWNSILFEVPWYQNYFWGLIVISFAVWILEIAFPWRKYQSVIRKDFWLDAIYMFFNFFIFAIVISGFYKILEIVFSNIGMTSSSISIINIILWPKWAQLLLFFVINDFVQWFTHVLLHKYDFLWRFHKVHHSVKEMGFAAHLRYHWMENIFYKPLKTLVVLLLVGGEPTDAFIIHFIAITIGHITWGPLKYVFNNPVMHLYHHIKALPENRTQGINFGISLSVWDYLFKTNYIPEDSGTIELGFHDEDAFPKGFFGQIVYGFSKPKK